MPESFQHLRVEDMPTIADAVDHKLGDRRVTLTIETHDEHDMVEENLHILGARVAPDDCERLDIVRGDQKIMHFSITSPDYSSNPLVTLDERLVTIMVFQGPDCGKKFTFALA